ncbi:unnamed protein product [Lampetra planeri]
MRTEGRLRGLRAKASADPLEVVPTFWVTLRASPRRNVAPHARARRESTRKQFLMSPPTWFGGGASGSGLEGPKFKSWRQAHPDSLCHKERVQMNCLLNFPHRRGLTDSISASQYLGDSPTCQVRGPVVDRRPQDVLSLNGGRDPAAAGPRRRAHKVPSPETDRPGRRLDSHEAPCARVHIHRDLLVPTESRPPRQQAARAGPSRRCFETAAAAPRDEPARECAGRTAWHALAGGRVSTRREYEGSGRLVSLSRLGVSRGGFEPIATPLAATRRAPVARRGRLATNSPPQR